jgi:predicted metallopeptidase
MINVMKVESIPKIRVREIVYENKVPLWVYQLIKNKWKRLPSDRTVVTKETLEPPSFLFDTFGGALVAYAKKFAHIHCSIYGLDQLFV